MSDQDKTKKPKKEKTKKEKITGWIATGVLLLIILIIGFSCGDNKGDEVVEDTTENEVIEEVIEEPTESTTTTTDDYRSNTQEESDYSSGSAWLAVENYGKELYPYGFKLDYWDTLAEEDRGNDEYFLKGYCTITNEYNASADYTFEATVVGSGYGDWNYTVTNFMVY